MPEHTPHLDEWTLEQLAENILPEPERPGAVQHVERCARCAAELEAHRSLFAALSELPRFAPSPGFSEAVMARIQVAPRVSPVYAWLHRWAPTSWRGWVALAAALLAPAAPVIALVVWIVSHPLLSPVSILQWTMLESSALAQRLGAALLDRLSTLGSLAYAQSVYDAVREVPLDTWMAGLILLAVAIPLSAWSLVRLLRTPTGNVTYAN